jgi:hypothetical protein
MSALANAQFKILECWALGIGWFMMGRFLQAGAVDLTVRPSGEVHATTKPEALWPWIKFAAIADPIKC